jgi:hypothetical protein
MSVLVREVERAVARLGLVHASTSTLPGSAVAATTFAIASTADR